MSIIDIIKHSHLKWNGVLKWMQHTLQKAIEQLKTNIFKQLHHRTLLKYTDEPILNENQLFFLLLPFLNGENWDDDLYTSVITVAMVHASLNEHEKIDENQCNK